MGVPELLLDLVAERKFKVIQEKTFATYAISKEISLAFCAPMKYSAPRNIFVQVVIDQVFGG